MYETRPWTSFYPAGVAANISSGSYNTLEDFLNETFTKFSTRVAFENMGKTMTFKELDDYSKNFGAYLRYRGLEPGDRIAIMMPNLLQYPIAIFGAIRAGLIIVNTNPLYTPREMLHQFEDSEVKAIIILENFASNLQKILAQTHIRTVIVASIGEMLGFVKGGITNFVVRHVKKLVPKYNIENTVKFKDCVRIGKKFKIEPFPNEKSSVILHQYTGGTTGVSKGAMLTNENLLSNLIQVREWLGVSIGKENEVALSPLPMYHIFAFCANCLAMLSLGVKTVLITNAKDIDSVLKEFGKNKITLMTGINTLFNAMMNHKHFDSTDFSALKITVSGGMALQIAVAERWKEKTGCDITEGYGMTESSPVASINPVDGRGRLGTIGIPVPSTDMRVVDEHYYPVPVGDVGEIQIKGPQVMKGYYKKPEETATTIRNGWLCTGDIGKMDHDGFFTIVDRKKDMILVSGFNVYPNEIEDAMIHHPKILEVAAVGIPNEKSGEAVKLYIVKKDKSLSEKEVLEFAKENLTGYKVPKEIEFRDELPKTNVGKILRRKLRDQ
ncbi:MAG TPA: AMP-binding protein [Saprospiraceae bacterium]|nr:AMP-binding protein [Lewinellaceae bacterium]HPQ20766.1 AMP-binding protein [Saprospiraceae bacterium]